MKKYIVCGTGDFSDIVSDLIERVLNRRVVAYALDKDFFEPGLMYHNKEVICINDVKKRFPPNEFDVVIGFIGKERFDYRERTYNLLKEFGYELENLIHPSAVISTSNIGFGNIILENCVIGYNVKMGNANIMWPLASINHHNIIGSFNNISPGTSTSGGVVIGNHCFLGNNSTYKNKVTVLDYTLVGAGAYISHDTESNGVYVPERSIKLDKTSDQFY